MHDSTHVVRQPVVIPESVVELKRLNSSIHSTSKRQLFHRKLSERVVRLATGQFDVSSLIICNGEMFGWKFDICDQFEPPPYSDLRDVHRLALSRHYGFIVVHVYVHGSVHEAQLRRSHPAYCGTSRIHLTEIWGRQYVDGFIRMKSH